MGTLAGTSLLLMIVPGLHFGDAKAAACHGPAHGMGGTSLFLWEALLAFIFVFVLYGERAGGAAAGWGCNVAGLVCRHWLPRGTCMSCCRFSHFCVPINPPGAIMHPPGHGALAPISAGVTLFACLAAGELREGSRLARCAHSAAHSGAVCMRTCEWWFLSFAPNAHFSMHPPCTSPSPLSGGQFTGMSPLNPAITLASTLLFDCYWRYSWMYLLAQVTGAGLAAGLAAFIYGERAGRCSWGCLTNRIISQLVWHAAHAAPRIKLGHDMFRSSHTLSNTSHLHARPPAGKGPFLMDEEQRRHYFATMRGGGGGGSSYEPLLGEERVPAPQGTAVGGGAML